LSRKIFAQAEIITNRFQFFPRHNKNSKIALTILDEFSIIRYADTFSARILDSTKLGSPFCVSIVLITKKIVIYLFLTLPMRSSCNLKN
jgi:hypothetical protein